LSIYNNDIELHVKDDVIVEVTIYLMWLKKNLVKMENIISVNNVLVLRLCRHVMMMIYISQKH